MFDPLTRREPAVPAGLGIGSVGYRRFPALLTVALVLCWAGMLFPILVGGRLFSEARATIEAGALAAYLISFFAFRPALRAPRSGAGMVGAVAMTLAGMLATAASNHESVSPVTLCVTAATAGFALSRHAVWVILALEIILLIIGALLDTVTTQWTIVLSAMIIFAAMVVEVSVREFYGRVKVAIASQALEEANRSLAEAQLRLAEDTRNAERLRISRDLHDAVGHRLTALSLRLEVASHLAEGPVVEHVRSSRELVATTLRDVRSVVSRLRDPSADLVNGLRELAATTGIPDARVQVDPTVPGCLGDRSLEVYRVVQEALTNVVRHANATQLLVDLVHDEHEHVVVTVSDNGVGVGAAEPGNGMSGMRERVDQLSGQLSVGSGRDGGTLVRAVIPCEP